MKKTIFGALLACTVLTGCLGTNALGGKVRKWNLKVVEHRWAREGVFLGLTIFWVYRICMVLDLLIFNSIEFWTGENNINGKKALADIPTWKAEKLGLHNERDAKIERLSETEAKLYVDFEDGDKVTFDVIRVDMEYSVQYQGKEFFKGQIQETASN